jgi:hypothetical protein
MQMVEGIAAVSPITAQQDVDHGAAFPGLWMPDETSRPNRFADSFASAVRVNRPHMQTTLHLPAYA